MKIKMKKKIINKILIAIAININCQVAMAIFVIRPWTEKSYNLG